MGGGSKDSTPRGACWMPIHSGRLLPLALWTGCLLPMSLSPAQESLEGANRVWGILVFPLSSSGQGHTAGTPAPGVCLIVLKHWVEACRVHDNS